MIEEGRRRLKRGLGSQGKIGIDYTILASAIKAEKLDQIQSVMNDTAVFEKDFKEEIAGVLQIPVESLVVEAEKPVVTKSIEFVTVTETVAPTLAPTTTTIPVIVPTTTTAAPILPRTTTPYAVVAATTTTTTKLPMFCPYKYTDLDAKNPCLLAACKNSTENLICKDGVQIYCFESKERQ